MSDAEDAGAATAVGREIWIEKYRPQTLDDIHGQEEIVERLQSYIEQDDVPHLLFSGPAGVGKCVTGETPVLTRNGVSRMEDIVGDVDGFGEPDEDLAVATMTDRNEFEYAEPSHVFGKRTDELIEIQTRDGTEFRVTPEHKLRVITRDGFSWIPAGELTDGDRIARPSRLPTPTPETRLRWFDEMDSDRTYVTFSEEFASANAIEETTSVADLHDSDLDADVWSEAVGAIEYVTASGRRSRPIAPPTNVTPALARFVGLTVSDARIDDGRIEFGTTEDELLDAFESAAHDAFDVETTRGTRNEDPYVAIDSRTLTEYLEAVFDVFASASGGNGIGSAIVTADDDSRVAFLQAMFDSEAHVSENGMIELTRTNADHVTLLAYLLATFGIPSRRTTRRKAATNGSGTKRTSHCLSVSGSAALTRFRDEIGFSITHRAERLAERTAVDSDPDDDTMPTQTVLRELCDRLDVPVTKHRPKSRAPESPGRENYCTALNDVVDAAAERIEKVQRAMDRLDGLEPKLAAATSEPAISIAKGEARNPIETRDEIEKPVENAGIDNARTELDECIQLIGADYSEVVEELSMQGSDLTDLLRSEESRVSSRTRFETVARRLREMAAQRLSTENIELIDEADRIANADLYYDRVETVERIDADERVYDLTVPTTRNYVAGSMPTVMHNTTAATAIARELYGEDWRGNFLELNASDQRGIDVVRDRIKGFARSSFGGDFRIVFLDEADSLTDDAQSALRRTMEQFSDNTRFILSCNYSSKIIDPIQSRCAVFRFSPLSDEAVAAQTRTISAAEGIEVTEEGIDALVYAADGDMRRAINSLQAAATTGDVVDEEAVYAITATARPEEIESMVRDALDGDFPKARATLDTLITETGMAGGDVIDQLHRSVWEFDLSERETVRLMERVGETDYRIAEGANERVQLEALLASLSLSDQ